MHLWPLSRTAQTQFPFGLISPFFDSSSFSGASSVVCVTPARGRGDETGSDLPSVGAVPQNIHSEA